MKIKIFNSREFVEDCRIQLLPIKANKKQPVGTKWNEKEYIPFSEIKSHKGNVGVHIGFNHKANGSSIACIDIDGFKFVGNNLKLLSEETVNSLTEEEKEDISLKTKEYIFDLLKEAFPNALHVRTQSGGYHIYVFNETVVDSQHITSKSLCFPEDYEIKCLRGVNLGASIEIFTKGGVRQCCLPPSKVNGNSYKLLSSGVDDWEDIEIVEDVNSTVKDILLSVGFTEDTTKNSSKTVETSVDYKGGLVGAIANIIKATEGQHNEVLPPLINLVSREYNNDTTKLIIKDALKEAGDDTSEHSAQISCLIYGGGKSVRKPGWPTLDAILGEDNKDLKSNLEYWLGQDDYINMEYVNHIQEHIDKEGFVPYMTRLLDVIMIGDKKPFLRLYLGSYYVISGLGSVIIEVVAESEDGKSFQYYLLNLSLPDGSFEEFNEITPASFVRMGNAWNNKIIYFGDQGDEKSEDRMIDVINIVKTLITEDKYRKLVCDTNLNTEDLSINVESIGAYYETTHTDVWGDDEQLKTRTISVTPDSVDKHDVIKRKGLLRNPNSKYAKAYHKVESELMKFKDFVKYLNSQSNNIIISHFTYNMDKYCNISDKIVRSFEQQMNLFLAYCTFTQNECIKYDGVLLASSKQFNEFLEFIADASTISSIEYNFIQMLLKKGFVPQEDVKHLYERAYMDEINGLAIDEDIQKRFNTFSMKNLELLPDSSINKIVKLMVSEFGVDDSKLPVFFTVKTLRNSDGIRKRKAFKNVSNMSALLNHLFDLGFLGKLDYQRRIGNVNENIYYLTDKVLDLDKFSNDSVYEQYTDNEIISMYKDEVENLNI